MKKLFKALKTIQVHLQEAARVSAETFEEAKGGWFSLYLPMFSQEKDGITYYVSTVAILQKLKMSSNIPMAMAVNQLDADKPPIIVVSQKFVDVIPAPFQLALLAHEQGHIELEHLKQKHNQTHPLIYMTRRLLRDKRVMQDEFEADAYSQLKGYDIVGALQWMRDNVPQLAHREVDIRIEELKTRLHT